METELSRAAAAWVCARDGACCWFVGWRLKLKSDLAGDFMVVGFEVEATENLDLNWPLLSKSVAIFRWGVH
ncbi:unnamed protein product [Rhodiola kirilowii]